MANRERILFFVSFGEHYVEIIADHDTHARVPKDVWNKSSVISPRPSQPVMSLTDCSPRPSRAALF
jgi:hypothetical protein